MKPLTTIHILQAKHAELLEALTTSRSRVHVEKLPDPMDDALASSNRAVEIETHSKNTHTLALVERAIKKLQNQSSNFYGICENCQEEIESKRLAAVPWASYCLDCAGRFERKPER